MALSARNQLKGTVKSIKKDAIMAEVVVELPGGQEIVSVITTTSAETLGVSEGKEITVVIKSTEVMLSN
ncbi:MAG: TOBE domain-containing protein [Anaerolineae bacterium]|nr:TOBE domain-containing protein [Anaerolineae bacterium]